MVGCIPQASHPDVQLDTKVLDMVMETYHWVNKLDTIVVCWIVAGSDHDTNCLSIELATAQSSQKADTEDHRVEEVAASSVSIMAAMSISSQWLTLSDGTAYQER